MSVVVIGVNHRTASLDLLERLNVDASRLPKVLHDLTSRPHISEAVVLSTCNRTEVYVQAERFHGAFDDVRDALCDWSHLPPEEFADHLTTLYDGDAIGHLFDVACGLDSAVLGEHEILGQVRSAWQGAEDEGSVGSTLRPVFRHALEVGKRARTDTDISRNVTSVSQAAVAMAAQHLGSLTERTVLLIGTGDMGQGMATALARSGVGSLVVANRTFEHAEGLAVRLGGAAARLDDLSDHLVAADVLLTSTGATSLMIEHATIDEVLSRRDGRPLLIVDIAVPRDVDPGAADIPGVTLLDMDDLGAFAEAGVAGRRREVDAVRAIIDDEVERYTAIASARELDPLITVFRRKVTEIAEAEAGLHGAELSDGDREALRRSVRASVNKMLHEPTVALKKAAGTARGERLADALRDLFDL